MSLLLLQEYAAKKALELNLNDYQRADAKMELGDILLLEEKFNQALIYYSQIQLDLKNDVMSHEASLKAAKTSYFKTDFEKLRSCALDPNEYD